MSIIESIHGRFVHTRRVRVLTELLSRLIPRGSRVLDVGTGDGWLAKLLADRCEHIYGSARDIEWAIASGTLYLLQCRAITKTG